MVCVCVCSNLHSMHLSILYNKHKNEIRLGSAFVAQHAHIRPESIKIFQNPPLWWHSYQQCELWQLSFASKRLHLTVCSCHWLCRLTTRSRNQCACMYVLVVVGANEKCVCILRPINSQSVSRCICKWHLFACSCLQDIMHSHCSIHQFNT